jgi:hypothetical protein
MPFVALALAGGDRRKEPLTKASMDQEAKASQLLASMASYERLHDPCQPYMLVNSQISVQSSICQPTSSLSLSFLLVVQDRIPSRSHDPSFLHPGPLYL